MTSDAVTNLSLSAVRAYQRCQQLYAYRYIDKIEKRQRAVPLELGTLLHEYLENFYTLLKDGRDGPGAHFEAQSIISLKWMPEMKKLAQAAFMTGDEEVAKEIVDMPRRAARISERYFEARGVEDAQRYDILFVERPLDSMLTPTFRSRGRADLVTRDRKTGRVSLWEHKSTKNVPPPTTRLRDLQTLLYAEQLSRFYDVTVDTVLWNYLRTKEPTVPHVLKSSKVPALSKAQDIDTTWEVYVAAAAEAGVELDDATYGDVRSRLEGRELTIFFPRYEQVIVANSTLMLRDYLRTGMEIRRFTRRVVAGEAAPIRTLDMACDYCEYAMLCQAEITGGDTEELIRMRFVRK